MSVWSSMFLAAFACVFATVSAGCQKPVTPRLEHAERAEPVIPPLETEGEIEGVTLRRDERMGLTLRIGGGEYQLRSERIPEEALDKMRFAIEGFAGIHGELLCVNADCSEAEIELIRAGRLARIVIRSLQLKTEIGQVRDGCETPLFFEEDLTALFDSYPWFQPAIEGIREVNAILATQAEVSGWTGEQFTDLELASEKVSTKIRASETQEVIEGRVTAASPTLGGVPLRVTRLSPGDLSSLSVLTFVLTQEGVAELEGMQKVICVDLRVAPHL